MKKTKPRAERKSPSADRNLAPPIRLGIDFGTTRTVVSRVESGNYPLVNFETESGEGQEWYPSLVAGKGNERVFGWEAWSKQSEEDWQKVRSLKRYLSHAHPETCLQVGGKASLSSNSSSST